MVISPKAKYIYIGRDGRDAVWSAFNHLANFKPEVFDLFNNTPGRVGPQLKPPSESVHEFYREWFAWDGYPLWPFWSNVRSLAAQRHRKQMTRETAGTPPCAINGVVIAGGRAHI